MNNLENKFYEYKRQYLIKIHKFCKLIYGGVTILYYYITYEKQIDQHVTKGENRDKVGYDHIILLVFILICSYSMTMQANNIMCEIINHII